MFDTKITNNQRYEQIVNIKPACTGLIQKSSPLSIITRCHLKSPLAETLLHPEGSYIERRRDEEEYQLYLKLKEKYE